MSFKSARIIGAFAALVIPGIMTAAPQLRLSQQVVGPISVAAGGNGGTVSLAALNIGDGALNLRASSSVPWLAPALGPSTTCVLQQGVCIPVTIALQTSALARGRYTGVVTISDPTAVDSPQSIRVTVQVGGGVPDRIDLFVAPNSSKAELVFSNNSPLNVAVSTQSGGEWLSVFTEGGNPFRPGTTYRAVASVPAGTAEDTYNGTVVTSGSALAAENKTIPVTLRVTSQPIAQLSADRVDLNIAQGSAAQVSNIVLSNRGLGTFGITGATATAASGGGNWLTATVENAQTGVVKITANPAGLAPGSYEGSVSVASNAVQGNLAIPVRLDVVAASAPVASFQGVVNNATFEADDVVAQGGIVAIFGEQFTTGEAKQASGLPLADELAGTRVFVNGQPAPVYYLSYNQINFQVPYDAAIGNAVVRIEREGQRGNDISVRIVRGAPRLLRLGIGDYGIVVNPDGTFPIPVTPGIGSRPAKIGETLVIYALGLGPTTPAVTSGTAAPVDPLARASGKYRVTFGIPSPFQEQAANAVPFYVGLTPNFVGLYQINVTIPEGAPRGASVPVTLVSDQDGASNSVNIAIE